MARRLAALTSSRSSWFDLGVFAAGMGLLMLALAHVVLAGGWSHPYTAALAIPLIVVIAKFPMVLDNGAGGIEVGFDSCILMFLLCTVGPYEAMATWSVGVLITQLTSDKRPLVKAFNIGVG